MHHPHAHPHPHPTPPARGPARGAFALAIALNAAYLVVEAGVGLAAGSLGLVADAGHNLSDVLALAVAWLGAALAARPPSERFTYGLRRSPVLASLFNTVLLVAAMGVVAWEAIGRLFQPMPVAGGAVALVAAGGLLVNGGTALLFVRGRADVNVRGAFLHMLSDAAVTFAVLVAGIVIALTGADWIDPVLTLAVVAAVLWSSWSLFTEALRHALDAVPGDLTTSEIRSALEGLPEVEEVHDLHVWGYGSQDVALTAHLVTSRPPARPNRLLAEVSRLVAERFGIEHCTVQVESGEPGDPCGLRRQHAP